MKKIVVAVAVAVAVGVFVAVGVAVDVLVSVGAAVGVEVARAGSTTPNPAAAVSSPSARKPINVKPIVRTLRDACIRTFRRAALYRRLRLLARGGRTTMREVLL